MSYCYHLTPQAVANPKVAISNDYYSHILNFIGFIALFLTLFVVKFAIDDLLFITKSYRDNPPKNTNVNKKVN